MFAVNQKSLKLQEQYDSLVEKNIIKNIKSCRNTNPEMMGKGIVVYNNANTYNVYDLKDENFDIVIMARSLSNQCRYNGHTSHFYSTAQHSVRMSEAALIGYGDVKLALACLIHDGCELAVGDSVSPIKREYPESVLEIEDKADEIVFKKYGVEEYLGSKLLKFIDVQICNEEMSMLLDNVNGIEKYIDKNYGISLGSDSYKKGGIHPNSNPFMFNPDCWHPEFAYSKFISQFLKLKFLIDTYEDKECYCHLGSHAEDQNKIKQYYNIKK